MKKANEGTYVNTDYSKSVDHYFYDGQIRKAQVQFSAIFSELKVKIGKNDFDSESQFITVPVKIGSIDRVVASIKAGNTQNKPIRVPAMAAHLEGIDQAWDFVKGSNQQARHTVFPVGGTLPNDGKVVYKYMPFPYFLNMTLTVIASNEYQHQQMVEQILLLFNPDLQIQISDGYSDWTKISRVELTGIGFDTPYPLADEARLITTTFSFQVLCYLSPPINIKDNYIKRIKMRLRAIGNGDDESETWDDWFIDVPGTPDEYHTVADVDMLDIPPR